MNKGIFETTTELFQIEDICKTSYLSDNEDAQLQGPERNGGERSRNQESKKKGAALTSVDRKVGECYRWKAIGQCSEGDSCSFSHDRASGNRCDQRQEGQSSCPAPKAKAQTDGKIPSRSSGRRGESPSGTRQKIPCRNFLRSKCTCPSCNFWHPPVCLNYKSESGCTYGEKCRFRHVDVDGKPSKKSKKSGVKYQLPY